ncbi:MAG: phage portal protein [Burkholderiales bacterium]
MPTLRERIAAVFRSAPQGTRMFRRFEAARTDRLTASWQAADTAIDQELRNDLRLLRRRARQMAKDNEYLKRFLSMVSANVVGQGMTLQSRPMETPSQMDNLAASAIETHWAKWSKPAECDIAGKMGLWTMMRSAVTGLARDGEILIRIHRGRGRGTYGIQLQMLDIERLDWQMNRPRNGGVNRVIMGVEVDDFGKAVAYHILENLPTTYGAEAVGKSERVPASDIIHAFLPTDPEQTRGYPWAHAAMRRLNDLAGYREAAVIAARVGAAKMGFFTSEQPDILADGQDGEVPYTSATPGEFGVLPPGTSFQSYDPQYPHDQFGEFIKATLRGISSALGVSYNTLANDLEGVNFSSIRSGVLEEREQWIMVQDWFIECVMDRVFEEWVTIGVATQAITQPGRNGPVGLPAAKVDKFREHLFIGRRWQWVDPLKDVQANIMAIEAGITTVTDVALKNGIDLEDVLATKQREQQLAAQYGVALGAVPMPAAPSDANANQDAPIRGLAAEIMRNLERRLDMMETRVLNTQNTPSIVVNTPDVKVNVEPPAIRNEIHTPAPVVNVESPTVNVAPAEVRVDAPQVHVAAPEVEVRVEATMPTPEVNVNLPARKTESTVERDSSGRIVKTTQIETDA